MSLELEVLLPDRVLLHDRVVSLQAADASGWFGLHTGHEDFLTVLVPCVVRFRPEHGPERFAAVDGGVLSLERGWITIATRDAATSERLDQVADAAAAMLEVRRQAERAARTGFAELEIALVRDLRKAVQRS